MSVANLCVLTCSGALSTNNQWFKLYVALMIWQQVSRSSMIFSCVLSCEKWDPCVLIVKLRLQASDRGVGCDMALTVVCSVGLKTAKPN